MEVLTTNFDGIALRYALINDNGILFNTTDICWILRILKYPSDSVLNESCLNIAGVIEAALSVETNNMRFVEWLESKFFGYDIYTPTEQNCDDDWKLKAPIKS